jgi:hypothetical protein
VANGIFFSLFRRINLKPNIKSPKMEDKKRIKENEKGSKNKPKQNITNTSPNPNVSSFLM